jgi:hypothetical protein
MAILELLTELKTIRESGWLINEASLVFSCGMQLLEQTVKLTVFIFMI